MTTTKDNSAKADLTTCSICFETFKTPKYFPCLHSFCEECIQTYITSLGRITCTLGVSCPMCRVFVFKPDDVSVEEWSTKLPTNHLLVHVIDMNECQSGQKLCAACNRVNESGSACSWCVNCSEALCKDCVRYHRKNKASSNHELVDLSKNMSTDIPLHLPDNICTEHPGNKLEAYCYDHSAICCITCVMLKHRKCENVCSVEDAASQMKQSEGVEKFEDHLKNLKQTLETLVQDRERNLQMFDAKISRINTDIDTLSENLWSHLIQLKKKLMNDVSMSERKVRREIDYHRDEIQYKISAVDNDLALFKTNMKHAPPITFLQAMEKLSDQRSMLEKFVTYQSQTIREIGVIYQANEKLLEMNQVVQEFGRVEITKTIKAEKM